MPLRGLLKKKDKIDKEATSSAEDAAIAPATAKPPIPEIIRTTTYTQEVIQPPTYPGDEPNRRPAGRQRKSFSAHFRKSSNVSTKSATASIGEKGDAEGTKTPPGTPPRSPIKSERRISERIKLGLRSRSASATSTHVPDELPEIQGGVGSAEKEVEWEKRATLLAKGGSADDIRLEDGVKNLRLGDNEGSKTIAGALAGDEGGDVCSDAV